MSILLSLYKQSLILDRNNKQLALMQNNARKLHMLGYHQGIRDLENVSSKENAIDLENALNSTELMAINSELSALDNCSSLNYLA